MNKIFILFTLVFFYSCAQKSEIKPLFEPKSISELEGQGKDYFTLDLKIPLTEDTLGYYDFGEIIEEKNLLSERTKLREFFDKVKYGVYNLGVNLKMSNRVRYSIDYEFPAVDPDTIKEIKIERVFFAIEDCLEEENCRARNNIEPSFGFLDKFFVNLSVIQKTDDLSFVDEPLSFLSKKDYEVYTNKAFKRIPLPFEELYGVDARDRDRAFYDVTVAKFENSKRRELRPKHKEMENIYYFKSKVNALAIRNYFQSKSFQGIVKDVTLVGDVVFVEIIDQENSRRDFFNIIGSADFDIEALGVDNPKVCKVDTCINFDILEDNLVPLLKKSSHLRIDTFASLRDLDVNDFKYSGYIQVKVKLHLPL
jgi:hypothetical protein